jgi:hypothetical protein
VCVGVSRPEPLLNFGACSVCAAKLTNDDDCVFSLTAAPDFFALVRPAGGTDAFESPVPVVVVVVDVDCATGGSFAPASFSRRESARIHDVDIAPFATRSLVLSFARARSSEHARRGVGMATKRADRRTEGISRGFLARKPLASRARRRPTCEKRHVVVYNRRVINHHRE